MIEAISDTHINKYVTFNDVLHVFSARGGTGTSIMDLKLTQELVSVDQDPLLLVLLYPRKVYGNLDRGRILMTLEGYGVRPKTRVMLEDLWSRHELVTQQNRYHSPQFRASRGIKKGDQTPPKLLNVALENVVRHWMSMAVEDDAFIHEGLGRAEGRSMGVFYMDDGIILSQDP